MPDGQQHKIDIGGAARIIHIGVEGVKCASCVARIEAMSFRWPESLS